MGLKHKAAVAQRREKQPGRFYKPRKLWELYKGHQHDWYSIDVFDQETAETFWIYRCRGCKEIQVSE